MPGRRRTGSRPLRTSISEAVYDSAIPIPAQRRRTRRCAFQQRTPRSPETDALLWRQVHLIADFDPKGLVERRLVHLRHGAAKLRRRVWIALDAHDGLVIARLGAPHLRPAHEEALLAGQPIDDRRRLTAQRQLIGLVCNGEAGVIGDVFAQRQLAIDRKARNRGERGVLRYQGTGPGFEVIQIRLREPARRAQQVAEAVVLTALVIEAVTDLVADHRANA